MLECVTEEAAIVVCNTCRYSAETRENSVGRRGGALLLEQLRLRGANVTIQEMPCFFNCERYCTVHLRAPGKVGYVLGDFRPTSEAADAILAFFRLYRDSEFGSVPYRQWPEGVKGHFIARVPPPGHVVAS
jgi:predicted metal-binding protein